MVSNITLTSPIRSNLLSLTNIAKQMDKTQLNNKGANGRGNNPFKAYKGAYDKLAQTHGKASSCIACRLCEKNCPQHIEISQWMKKLAKVFEA